MMNRDELVSPGYSCLKADTTRGNSKYHDGQWYDIMNRWMADPAVAILPCHMAAYMMHPKYNGQDMDLEDAEKARAWLAEINPDFVASSILFQTQALPYPKSYFLPSVAENTKPHIWW